MKVRILDYRPPKIAQLLILVATALHWATPLSKLYIYSNKVLGIILGISGFIVMMWGWYLFKKFDAAICPTAKTEYLITTGIYKYTRNPMYLGIITMLLAVSCFVGTVPFYLATLAYFIIINRVFYPYEESKLIEPFGKSYASYCNNVRRWL